MPKLYPEESRRDVVAVARKHEAPLSQTARDVGISSSSIHNGLRKADVDDGVRPGVTTAQAEKLRALRRRDRRPEQENEILRRAAAFNA